jgi:hypothetical protein
MPFHLGKSAPEPRNNRAWPRIFVVAAFVLLAVGFAAPKDARAQTAPWYNTSWAYRKKITITPSNVAGTVTSFPVVVNRTDPDWRDASHSGHVAQSNGNDILFTDADGTTKLNHEIETYDNTAGTLVAWVQVPFLSSTSVLYIYYGNVGASNQQNVASTWNNNYVGVWHFPDGTTLSLNDSANGNNGTSHGSPPPGATTGQIDGGAAYPGAGDWVGTDGHNLTTGDVNGTFEIWFHAGGSGTMGCCSGLFNQLSSGAGTATWELAINNQLQLWSDVAGAWEAGNATITAGSWTHVVVVTEASDAILYLNGALDKTLASPLFDTGSHQAPNSTLCIGGAYSPGTACSTNTWGSPGDLDEVRYSSVARSAAWIKTEYNNQSSPSTFYTVWLEEPGGIQVTSRSDTLSNAQPSATSNHTLTFTTNNSIYGSSRTGSSTVKLTFPADFTMPSNLNCGDIDAATSSQFNFNYPGCNATATAWGMSVNAISFVQQNTSESGASQYNSTAFSSPNTAGNLIVLALSWSESSLSILSVTDTVGNVYTSAIGPVTWNGSYRAQIFYAKNIKGGSNTVTVKLSGTTSSFFQDQLQEYSGADLVSPLDAVSSSSAPAGITAVNSGTSTTQFANEMIFGFGAAGSCIISAGAGFTVRSTLECNVIEDKNVTSAGPYNATAVGDGTVWVMLMATFKAASSITLIPPTGTGELVAAGTPITIKIGSNATQQQQGQHWITNPSSPGTYTITVGGTFGGSGDILVAINAGVTVKAYVAESLSLTISDANNIQAVQTNLVTGNSYWNGDWQKAVSFNSNVHQGDAIIVTVQDTNSGVNPTGVTDTLGNSYSQAIWDTNNGYKTYLYYALNSSAGADTVTVHFDNGPMNVAVVITEYSGIAHTNALDKTAQVNDAPASQTATTTSVVTDTANELLIGTFFVAVGNPSWSPLNGFSERAYPSSWGTFFVEDRIVSAAGTYYAAADESFPNSDSYAAMLATFRGVSCTADDGASITQVNTTAASVPFGTISANTFYQGCQDLSVSTNAAGGYSLTVQESSAMQTADGKASIPDTACDSGQCSSVSSGRWVTATKYGLGHTCLDQTGHDCSGAYSEGTKFRPFANVAGGTTSPISFIQQNSGNMNIATGGSLSFPLNNTGGNLILACADWGNSLTVTVSMSDSQGNNYASAVGPINDATIPTRAQCFYAKNIKAGPNSVTLTPSASAGNYIDFIILEYAGLDQTNPLDAISSGIGNATPADSGSAATNAASELIFGYVQIGTAPGCTAGTGFTVRSGCRYSFGPGAEDKIVNASGSYNATFNINGGAQEFAALMATFRASPASGEVLMSSSTPAIATGRVKYRLSAPPSLPAGTYTNTIIYTILGTF